MAQDENEEQKKYCHKCKKFERISRFNFKSRYHRDRHHLNEDYDGRKEICKFCEGLAHSAWRKKNREYLSKYAKAYYQKNKKKHGKNKVQRNGPRTEQRHRPKGPGTIPLHSRNAGPPGA